MSNLYDIPLHYSLIGGVVAVGLIMGILSGNNKTKGYVIVIVSAIATLIKLLYDSGYHKAKEDIGKNDKSFKSFHDNKADDSRAMSESDLDASNRKWLRKDGDK